MEVCFFRYLELYEWELDELPFINSVVGRHVYVCMARKVLRERYFETGEVSIKSLLSNSLISDRAVRIKIREFEKMGYVESELNSYDKRLKVLRPTEKLLQSIEIHTMKFYQSINQDYHLIKR